mmetsp:Transcript_4786/g.8224  ORF Transcript_4786/g.8224 Transcript_4786/m.8224 type:complete len:257 (-) Transcript_4786:720-1490(-)
MLMPLLPEVAFVRAAPPVGVIPADLTLELLVEPVELVQPIGDRLAVEPKRQLEGVIDGLLFVTVHVMVLDVLVILQLSRQLLMRARQLLLHILNRSLHRLGKLVAQADTAELRFCHFLRLRHLLGGLLLAPLCHGCGSLDEHLGVQRLQRQPLGGEQAHRPLQRRAPSLHAQRLQHCLDRVHLHHLQHLLRSGVVVEVDGGVHKARHALALILPPLHFSLGPLRLKLAIAFFQNGHQEGEGLRPLVKGNEVVEETI